MHYLFPDLSGASYTFGRGECCDYQFDTSTTIGNACFQAFSKLHFKVTRVRFLQITFFCMFYGKHNRVKKDPY